MESAMLKMLWTLANNYRQENSLIALVEEFGEQFEWTTVDERDVLAEVLEELKEQSCKTKEINETFYGEVQDMGIYWMHTPDYFEWFFDEPDFWEEVFELQ